jgi:SET domain-containing protein
MYAFLPSYPWNLLLIVLGLMILLSIYPRKDQNDSGDYPEIEGIQVRHSEKIGSRGLFATRNFGADEIIEVCPLIMDDDAKFKGKVRDYVFEHSGKKGTAILPIGYTAIINHSDEPNVYWRRLDDRMVTLASKNIYSGEEFFHDYGDRYWKTREKKIEKI